jgi:hypothetical protein
MKHKHTQAVFCALAVAVFVILPRIVLWTDSHFTVHDFLDSEVPTRVALTNSGMTFQPDGVVPQLMNGLPRQFMLSGYNVIMWLFFLLGPFTALVVNELLVRLAAFWGMYLLLETHILPRRDAPIAIGVALCFSLLPFYTIYGLSIAGQPLLYYAFLNLWKCRRAARSYIIIIVFAFYSFLVLSGALVTLFMGVCIGIASMRAKQLPRLALVGYVILVAGYVFAEHNLLRVMLFQSDFVSHRSIWGFSADELAAATATNALKKAYQYVVDGHYHADGAQQTIAIFLPLVLVLGLFKRKALDPAALKILILVAVVIVGVFVTLAFLFSKPGLLLHQSTLRTFQFTRVYWLVATLWYIGCAAGLAAISIHKRMRVFILVLIIGQLYHVLAHSDEIKSNYEILYSKIKNQPHDIITFRKFYDSELLERVGTFIGKPKAEYRVVSIGMDPAVATYNGFYTLDGYHNNYSLSYKRQFREIIAEELEKNARWRMYFDSWGNRCYVFASELDEFDNFAISEFTIQKLQLNTAALKDLNGDYVFSAVRIVNATDTNLRLLKTFESDGGLRRIFLYQVL